MSAATTHIVSEVVKFYDTTVRVAPKLELTTAYMGATISLQKEPHDCLIEFARYFGVNLVPPKLDRSTHKSVRTMTYNCCDYTGRTFVIQMKCFAKAVVAYQSCDFLI